jgi:hypothetical protein
VASKFDRLAGSHVEPKLRDGIRAAVADLEQLQVDDLTRLLATSARADN